MRRVLVKSIGTGLAALLATVVMAVAPAAASTVTVTAVSDMPEPPPVDVVRAELATLVVELPHPMVGYSRAKFPHWIAQGASCDTREVVLARDGGDVTADSQCRAVSGTWYSPYDDKTLTSAGAVDIDHIVPLANAWRSGADLWDTPTRKKFANDLVTSQLIAVSASSNRAKGDQSPDQWAPSNAAYHCTYSRAWTHIKHEYSLSVTAAEVTALTDMLDTCG